MIEEPFVVKEGAGTPSPGGLPSMPGSVQKDEQPAIPDVLPILPIRDMVVFPGTVVPLTIRREASLKLLDASLPADELAAAVRDRIVTLLG